MVRGRRHGCARCHGPLFHISFCCVSLVAPSRPSPKIFLLPDDDDEKNNTEEEEEEEEPRGIVGKEKGSEGPSRDDRKSAWIQLDL